MPLKHGDYKSITGWKVLGPDINSQGWPDTNSGIDYYKGSGPYNPARYLDLNGTPGPGGIAQPFATDSGSQYKVTFDMAGHPSGLNQKMRVLALTGVATGFAANGQWTGGFGPEGNFDFPSGTDPNNLGWKKGIEWTFLATTDQTTLEFLSSQKDYKFGGPTIANVKVEKLGPAPGGTVVPPSQVPFYAITGPGGGAGIAR